MQERMEGSSAPAMRPRSFGHSAHLALADVLFRVLCGISRLAQ
jgi:hypothetical protein